MTVNEYAAAEPLPQKSAGAVHLLDNLGDADIRAEIVAGHRHGNAARIQSARHLAEERRIERAPPAAMNEQRERRIFAGLRQEQVDILPRRIAIGEAKLGAAGFERVGAIILSFPCPAGKNLRMFRHAGAIVVFGFVVDGGHRRLLADYARKIAACAICWQVAAPFGIDSPLKSARSTP